MLTRAETEARALLAPANPHLVNDTLEFLLVLVVPTGMSEAERSAWMTAARAAVRHLPGDQLQVGARAARALADHPSKVIPALLRATDDVMARRTADLRHVQRIQAMKDRAPYPWEEQPAPPVPTSDDPDVQAAIDAALGVIAKRTGPRPEPRTPTPSDYAAMGVGG